MKAVYRVISDRLTAIATILCIVSAFNFTIMAAQAPYEVGQYWRYNHQGPRPGAAEPKAIDGERILHVIGTVGTDPEQQWIIEDRFTNDPNIVGRLQVRGDRMLTAIVIENEKGESLTLSYDQPIPYQCLDLKVGDSKRIETTLVTQPGGFKLPCTLEITRLDDQTPDAPDARFADCRVYRSVTTSIFNIKVAKIPIRETRQWWYSPSVGATVKEVYTRDPVKFLTWSQDGYTATTTLAAFGIRGISLILPAPAIRDDTNLAAPPADVEAQRNWKWPAVAVCVVAAVIGLRRYARTRTPHQ
jgi:hypothetical protein